MTMKGLSFVPLNFFFDETIDKILSGFTDPDRTNLISFWKEFEPYSNNYPVTNIFLAKDGSVVLEIAVCGFKKDEIFIEREDAILNISATKKTNETNDMKEGYYALKKISTKNWSLSYKCSERMDLDNISSKLENGIISIEIPLKESAKPIKKKIEIL